MPSIGENLSFHQDQADRLDAITGVDSTAPRPEASVGSPEAAEASYWEQMKFTGGNLLKAMIADPMGVLREAGRFF